MTVIRFERAGELGGRGIDGDSDSRQVRYLAFLDDFSDTPDIQVLDYAESNVPSEWDGMPRGPFSLEQLTPLIYLVTANFRAAGGSGSLREDSDEDDPKAIFAFEIGTEDVDITHGFNEQRFDAAGFVGAQNFVGAIGVEVKEGKIELKGAKVPYPVQEFEISLTAPYAFWTNAYREILEGLAGKINDAEFLGRPKGSVLFRGVRGRIEDSGSSELIYRFAVKNNPVLPKMFFGVTIPDSVSGTPVHINGWDVVWPLIAEEVAGTAVQPEVRAVYIDQVLEYGDFSLLDLPTIP